MATLYKHGISRQFEYINQKIAVCQDGKILRNQGDGWKLSGKIKPGVTYDDACRAREARIAEVHAAQPCFAAYKKTMLEWKLADRRMILLSFEMLGDDLDGIWSELNDHARIQIDLEEIREIHQARKVASLEKQRLAGN